MYPAPCLVRLWMHAHASVHATFGRFFGGISTAPCIWQSLVRLFVPEEHRYTVFLGVDFRKCRMKRCLDRQWIRYCQSTEAWVLFPYTAQCLVLSGTCYPSVTEFVVEIPVVVQRPFPMVQTVCWTKEIPLLLDKVIDVLVAQGRAASQVVVQTCRKLRFPTVAVLGHVGGMPVVVNDRSWMCRRFSCCGYGRPCDHAETLSCDSEGASDTVHRAV